MEMLTSKDMQELLQVDRSTIYRMAESGRLPAIKVGKQWRFPGDRVESWFQLQIGSAPQATPSTTLAPASNDGTLASLLPLECVQLIQETYADALGIMLVLTDMSGNPITQVSNPCGLFSAVNQVPDALQHCIQSWHSLANSLDLEPKWSTSHLGLLCTRGLLRIGHELKGMVVAGCIAPDSWPPPEEQAAAIAAEFGVTEAIIKQHIQEVYHVDLAGRQRLLPLVQRIANVMAHIASERQELFGRLSAIAKLTVI